MLFCHVTTRVDGDAYPNLLREKGGSGFPYLAFLDAEGTVLAKQGDRTVAGFQKTRETCAAFLALEKKAKAGDKSVAADLLVARLEMGQLKHADAKQAAADLGKIDAPKQKKIDALVFGLEVQDMLAGLRSQDDVNAAGRKCKVLLDEGRVPTGPIARTFYSVILSAAEADKDAKTYEKALAGLKEVVGDDARARKTIERMEQTLEKLKSESK